VAPPGFCQPSRQRARLAEIDLRYRGVFGREPVVCGVWTAARRPSRSGLIGLRSATAGSDAGPAASSSTSEAWGS
jgi:hypothetical protein